MEVNELQSQIFFVIHVNFSLLSQFLGPNAACTKFGVIKCQIAPRAPLVDQYLISSFTLSLQATLSTQGSKTKFYESGLILLYYTDSKDLC